jgi:hypothetical protein
MHHAADPRRPNQDDGVASVLTNDTFMPRLPPASTAMLKKKHQVREAHSDEGKAEHRDG